MRELIKKLLLEHALKSILSEGIATVRVPPYINKEIESYLSDINNGGNGFYGRFRTEQQEPGEKPLEKLFVIDVTYHYKQRLFRTEEPEYKENGKLYDPRIVNPDTLEGINLIYRNRDYIADLIHKGTISTDSTHINFFSRDLVSMSVIVVFDKDLSKKNKYKMTLVTQLKGVRFNRNNTRYPTQKSIGLSSRGTKINESIVENLIRRIQKKLGLIT